MNVRDVVSEYVPRVCKEIARSAGVGKFLGLGTIVLYCGSQPSYGDVLLAMRYEVKAMWRKSVIFQPLDARPAGFV